MSLDTSRPILVTGAAGFIGFHVAARLLGQGVPVVGLDNVNDYYDTALKESRLRLLLREQSPLFRFERVSLGSPGAASAVMRLWREHRFKIAIHLAAQAGVGYSMENPRAYVDSNVAGFLDVLEACRSNDVDHLIYASSSSVYGANTKMPFSEHHSADHPVSVYAATKRANELMAHTYSHAFGLPTTGLRFFTVYGPWGRPDMALFKFTKAILAGESIQVYNYGRLTRDFTYIDDIVEGIFRLMERPARPNAEWNGMRPDPATSTAPYRLYNIGSNNPASIMDFIAQLERSLGKKAIIEFTEPKPGDLPATYADVDDLMRDAGYKPDTPLAAGIDAFARWYRMYYRI